MTALTQRINRKQLEASRRRFLRYRQLFNECAFGTLWTEFTHQPLTPQSSLSPSILELKGCVEWGAFPDFRFEGAEEFKPQKGLRVKPCYKAKGAGA